MLRLVVIMGKSKSVAQKQREFGQGLKEQSRCEEFKEKDKIRNRKINSSKINVCMHMKRDHLSGIEWSFLSITIMYLTN